METNVGANALDTLTLRHKIDAAIGERARGVAYYCGFYAKAGTDKLSLGTPHSDWRENPFESKMAQRSLRSDKSSA